MNSKKHFRAAVGLVMAVALIILTGSMVADAAEKKCRIIQISHPNDFVPGTLKANKGDCIVWVNFSQNRARIIFAGDSKCENMSMTSGFTVAPKGCYVMDRLEPGMTSSISFSGAGTFEYAIEFYPSGSSVGAKDIGVPVKRGTIIVK
jgi:hypothetical protein